MMVSSHPVSLSRIGQIALSVHDVARATAFYRDTLGMTLLFEAGGMAFFDCGGIRLMLAVPEQKEFEQSGSVLYFRVDDIGATHAELSSRGVQIERAPHLVARLPGHDLWLSFFRDSEGNLLALMSEVRS
ncbi:MAG TPA: VOC family protein [Gemmatimonadaceae bacterium]|nr:VOC family protein [Gemmatimonadaceae bacterium]